MVRKECIYCIKRKTEFCPNSEKCYSLDYLPYFQTKLDVLKENQKYKEVIDKLTFIKNRARAGATQETINKLAITFVNAYLKEVE